MTENSDKKMYDSEARIDELLNSYIDGELTVDQQSDVEELIARDDGITQRLRQFQQCKTFIGALPRAEAPPHVLEGVKAAIAGKAITDRRTQKTYPRFRRVLAAAAMIGIAALITTVMRTMTSPKPPVSERSSANIPAPREFSGKLELRTSDLVAVSASVNKALEGIHHSEAILSARREDRRIYSLSCSKEDLKSLLANIEHVWPELDSATLSVNTGVFGEKIVVETVTTEQVSKIIEQDNPGKRIEIAKDFAVLNHLDSNLMDRAIANAIEGQSKNLTHPWQMYKPSLAEREDPTPKTLSQHEDKDTIYLTIILSW
ncbi:MAG: hypothetical protein JXM79_04290 [Sedimentisphaerales bacterium]|nr:hypothetical protein [Sedimentisphaerales bacterium]